MNNQQDTNHQWEKYRRGTGNGYGGYSGEYYHGETIIKDDEKKDEIDLKHLINVSLRYKWWVLTITAFLTVLAAVYAYSLESVYESSGTIIIAEERNRYTWANSDISSIVSSSFGVGTGSRLVNEIQVFQSRRLARAIADKIIARDLMENEKRFPILWRQYPTDSTQVSAEALTGRIRSRMNVSRVDMDTDILRVTYTSPSPIEASYLVNTTIDTYTEVSANQRRMAANSALEFLQEEQQQAHQRLVGSEEELRDYMSRTNLVQIDGQTNAAINRIAELESQRQQVQVEKVAVNSSIQAYEDQLDQIRPGLAEQFADNVSSTMERSQFRLAELETERMMLLQNNPTLRDNPQAEPQLVKLNNEIEVLKNEINRLANELIGDDSDVFIGFLNSGDGGMTSRIIELRQNLIELKIQESQLKAQEEVLNDRRDEENQFFEGLPENMIELARLRRNTQVNEQLYSTISEQFTQTSLWKQTQFGAGRPLDYGITPNFPSGPNRTRYIMIGFLLGMMTSVGFVFARENLNRKIDGTDKLRKTGFPLLAIIPDLSKHIESRFEGRKKVIMEGKQVSTVWSTLLDTVSPLAESYRRLHNNIVYADPDKVLQTILVTSSKKGEGKTTVSINLAVALAESGKKVLLIDTDLRRPALHDFTGEAREPGVVELFYDNKALNVAIKPTIAPAVHLLTAGRSIPNPSAVLQSAKLRALLAKVKDTYDHIIIDTPPYGVITDAAPIMKLADGVLVVTRFVETQTNELAHTLENLKRINANIIGTVITAYRHRDSADYYYSNEYTYDTYSAYEEYRESTETK